MSITSLVIFNYRFTLRGEKKKTEKCHRLHEKYNIQLRNKEQHSIKDIEINPQSETTIRAQNITLAIIREEVNLSLGKISYF